MKKLTFILLFLLSSIVISYSQTQNSTNTKISIIEVEKDARKMGSFMCELKTLADNNIEENKEKIQEVAEKMKKFREEMEKKYRNVKKDAKMSQKVQEAFRVRLEECGLDETGMGALMMKIMKAGIKLN